MRSLISLDPYWARSRDAGPWTGVRWTCPICTRDHSILVYWTDPPTHWTARGNPVWEKTGETFETLTLTPSIDCSPARRAFETDEAFHRATADPLTCRFHGWITHGEVIW